MVEANVVAVDQNGHVRLILIFPGRQSWEGICRRNQEALKSFRADACPVVDLVQRFLIRDPERHLAFEDVEPLVLFGMDVPGRADALRGDDLDQTVLPGRVVPADLDRLQHAEQPERLAFVLVERVPELCSI